MTSSSRLRSQRPPNPRPHRLRAVTFALVTLASALATHSVAEAQDDMAPPTPTPTPLAQRVHQAAQAQVEGDDAPIVAIEDSHHNLARVHRALRDVATGRAGRLKVRVAVYGDSNHLGDHASASLRRRLGAVFGYGGHGYIAGARPQDWYQHQEIHIRKHKRGWKAYSATTPQASKPWYGHGGHLGLGRAPQGAVVYESAEQGVAANRVFSHIQVFYVCHPRGGLMEVVVDDEAISEIDTRCQRGEALKHATLVVPEGPHTVKLLARRGRVSVLGVSFENNAPGVVVDGLGVGALNMKFMMEMDERLFIDAMRARDYDLVILHTGSNMWAPRLHPGYFEGVIKRIRAALGDDVSILVLSAPDFTRERSGPGVGHKRMRQCRDEKRALSRQHRVAFWDFYEEMGGRGSIMRWRRQGMVKGDLVHFKPPFFDLMMGRLTRVFLEDMLQKSLAPDATLLTAPQDAAP